MWLAQEQTPSYKTINRFRSNPKTNELIKECFTEFREFLVTNNYIDEDAVYIDGTKLKLMQINILLFGRPTQNGIVKLI